MQPMTSSNKSTLSIVLGCSSLVLQRFSQISFPYKWANYLAKFLYLSRTLSIEPADNNNAIMHRDLGTFTK